MPTWHGRYIGRRKGVQTRWKRRRTTERERGEEKQRKKGAFLRPFSASRRNLILDWISALCRSRETLLRSSSRRFDPACRVSSQTLGTSTTLFPTSFSLLLEISSCSRSIIGIAKQEEALSTRSTLSDLSARLHVAIAIPWHTIMKIYRELPKTGMGSSRDGLLPSPGKFSRFKHPRLLLFPFLFTSRTVNILRG